MVARTAMMATVVAHAVVTAVMSTVVSAMRSSIRRQRHQQCGHGCRNECKAPQQGFSPFVSASLQDEAPSLLKRLANMPVMDI
jgi:hypothetical protein